jgi:phosphoribosylformylglycinamidine synthase subunit PurQ / glutaminase
MRAAIVVFPGSNRERDLARALRQVAGARVTLVWHAETTLPEGTDLVALPGGFSHGDYLRCGAIAARSAVMRAVADHAGRGGLVLGICNGFQILCEAGLLPGVLVRNAGLKFQCRAVDLVVERTDTAFTRAYAPGAVLRVPIAHGEGNYVADANTIAELEGEGRVVFRYASDVNGSTNRIAGIRNAAGNVVGLMPHPENAVEVAHGSVDGRGVFGGLASAD